MPAEKEQFSVEKQIAEPVFNQDDVVVLDIRTETVASAVSSADVDVFENERRSIEIEKLRDELWKRRLVLWATMFAIGAVVVGSYAILVLSEKEYLHQFATHSLSTVLGLAAASLWPSSKSDSQ